MQTTFAQFKARAAEQQEYDLQRDYAITVVGLKHVDAGMLADGRRWGRSGLNLELKKLVGCFTYEFVQTKAHVSWKRVSELYTEHVLACINWHSNSEEHTRASLYMNALVQLRAAVATLFDTPACPMNTCRMDVQIGLMPATEEQFVPCWGSPPRDHEFESFSMPKLDGGNAFEKQESKTAPLCLCGYDRAACGACAQGWAQRNQQDSSRAHNFTSDLLWPQQGDSVQDCVNVLKQKGPGGSPAQQDKSPEREPPVNSSESCASLELPCARLVTAPQDCVHVDSSVDWRSAQQKNPASLADECSAKSGSSEHPSLESLRSAAGVHSPPASYIGTGESLQLPKVRSASSRVGSVHPDRFSSNRADQHFRLQCSVDTLRLVERADCIIHTEEFSSRRGRNASDGVWCLRKTRAQHEAENPSIIEVSATQQESDKINRLISLLFEGLLPHFGQGLGRRARNSQDFRNKNFMVQRWFKWIRQHRGRLSAYPECQTCMWLDMVMAQQLVSWEVAGITSGNRKDMEKRCIPGFSMRETDKAKVIRSVCIAFVVTDASRDERARVEHLDRIRADLGTETQ